MNDNIINLCFSYLNLKEVSDVFEILNLKPEVRDLWILALTKHFKSNFYNIKAKLNNYQNRCGECNIFLNGNYWLRSGIFDCNFCSQRKGFHIYLCNECKGKESFRGLIKHEVCFFGKHSIIDYGVNFLS